MRRAHQREAKEPHQSGRVMMPSLPVVRQRGRRFLSHPVRGHMTAIVVPAQAEVSTTTGQRTIIWYILYATKLYLFSTDVWVKLPCVVGYLTIDEGLGYVPLEGLALYWAPLAFALYAVFGYSPGRILAYYHEVCLIALAYETSLTDAKQGGWVVCHEFYEPLDGKHLFIYKAEHTDERELYHRHT